MSSTLSAPTSTVGSFTREAFAAHLQRIQHLPAWWLERKRVAYERFAALPPPVRTDEGWRFSNLSGLSLEGFHLAAPIGYEQVTHQDLGVPGAGTLLLANHHLVHEEKLSAELAQQGVIFTTLQQALLQQGELVRAHLLSQPSKLGSEKFVALHEAFVENGAFVYVPRDVTVALPFGIFHYASGSGTAVFPHTLVVAEDNAR